MKIMKAGYRVEIESSENDWDNVKTAVRDGLTLDEARCYIDVCRLFVSKNDPDLMEGQLAFGNRKWSEDNSSELDFIIEGIFDARGVVLPDEFDDWYMVPSLLIGDWCEGEYYRVLEEIKLFHLPEEIRIQEIQLGT